jgi:hypothetical protein
MSFPNKTIYKILKTISLPTSTGFTNKVAIGEDFYIPFDFRKAMYVDASGAVTYMDSISAQRTQDGGAYASHYNYSALVLAAMADGTTSASDAATAFMSNYEGAFNTATGVNNMKTLLSDDTNYATYIRNSILVVYAAHITSFGRTTIFPEYVLNTSTAEEEISRVNLPYVDGDTHYYVVKETNNEYSIQYAAPSASDGFTILRFNAATDYSNIYSNNGIDYETPVNQLLSTGGYSSAKSALITARNYLVTNGASADDINFDVSKDYYGYTSGSGMRLFANASDNTQSGSFGDPYIWSIKSKIPVKLPNKKAVYRMFEQGNNFVNASVDMASENHKERMEKWCESSTLTNIITDGFFYNNFFIHASGHELTINPYTRKCNYTGPNEEKMGFFTISSKKDVFKCGGFYESCEKFIISWKDEKNETLKTEIMFFRNPHIENGINIIPNSITNAIGMIVDNYKPKLMQVPFLTTTKYKKLYKNIKRKNIKQIINIKKKNEIWVYGKGKSNSL